jgi:hypothetical protein
MSSGQIESVLFYSDGRTEELPMQDKDAFAKVLIERAGALFK